MNSYAILVSNGYDFEFETSVEAPNAKAARKRFVETYKGPKWRIEDRPFKASLIAGRSSLGHAVYKAMK